MPRDLTTDDTVETALTMFPDATILPNAGCTACRSCQLITRSGLSVITVHHPECPSRARA